MRQMLRLFLVLILGFIVLINLSLLFYLPETKEPEPEPSLTGIDKLSAVEKSSSALLFPPKEEEEEERGGREGQRRRISWVTQWYREKSDGRRQELMEAVVENLKNKHIFQVHLLHEPGEKTHSARLILASEFNLSPVHVAKLIFHSQGRPGRLLLKDAFSYVNQNFAPNDIVIFANTDISFDSSLKLLLGDENLINTPRYLYSLSRYEFHPTPKRPSMCSRHYQGSHDSFIFTPPLSQDLLDRLGEVKIGDVGYENRLMFEFQREGFLVKNPCLSVKSFHHHNSGIKSHNETERVNTRNRTMISRPSFHHLDSGEFLQNSVQYLDFGEIASILRENESRGPLCEIPPELRTLVSHFCRPGQANVSPWNCTHLPCSILTPQAPIITECKQRMHMYRCQRHTSLAVLLENRDDLAIHFEGRFPVNLSFFDELERWRRIPHPWLFSFIGESVYYYPKAADPMALAHFNWTFGYDGALYDERVSLFLNGKLEEFLRPPRPRIPRQGAQVMMLISNCRDKNNRLDYARELMKHIEVDSFGRCLKNRNISDVLPQADQLDPFTQKVQLMARYHFVISFENANLHDYITEKLWEPLKNGIVPIYYGAPNVDDYLPGPNSIIRAEKFPPEKLAAYLQTLIKDQGLYKAFFDWKKKPSKQFIEHRAHNNEFFPVQCGICQRMWDFYSH